MRKVAILGSTGSIGCSALEVVKAHPERLAVTALAAGRNRDRLREQCEAFKPRLVSVATEEDARWLKGQLAFKPDIAFGAEGLMACALHGESDTVLASVVGAAGLPSTEAALRAGLRVCVANKESLVVGGALMRRALAEGGGELLPVDSEHAALHQLLADRAPGDIAELRLTASGGPFRDWPLEKIRAATRDEALNHPTWKMGPKITIDSATLMNKGLEVIEASVLFGVDAERIAVTVHPQSQVHAMVGFTDGSYQLQVCANDMKLPIQYCLLYPEKVPGPVPAYSWDQARSWTFEAPDLTRFPLLGLAFDALRAGGTAPAILNAANEVAVAFFLEGRLGFWDIQALVRETLNAVESEPMLDLPQVLDADRRARAFAETWAARHAS
ncbi:MAG TPA: 1-deoxy-D-xylulose-5-phosphate reductoisomerase [Holophagaceae bacterium]|nr:1-deoxy-D-xylulose-5-phosphate reductoisomerase [Holophagaceae bacterium]